MAPGQRSRRAAGVMTAGSPTVSSMTVREVREQSSDVAISFGLFPVGGISSESPHPLTSKLQAALR
jgi:hypothetical protein